MPTTKPRWFGVSSPEYETYGGDLMDPPEYGRDWLPVLATSARRARLLAFRAWRRRGSAWWSHHERDRNPFAGMHAVGLVPCHHGNLFDCAACEEEFESSLAAARARF